ncbi:hypothetical protein GQ607_013482 [Colletotrichum asianum]|uniref:Uncharacterized protein n=1 Tax=Colletotrichum asianum TaxID=702518 RepID=A0A8H3W6S7_9PEZI|nr:hypothetical protein GQ607_013482 [Colletotrichum asianum]
MPMPTRTSQTPKACRKRRETVTESIRTKHTRSSLPPPQKTLITAHTHTDQKSRLPQKTRWEWPQSHLAPRKPSPRPKTSAITKTQISPYEHVDAPN